MASTERKDEQTSGGHRGIAPSDALRTKEHPQVTTMNRISACRDVNRLLRRVSRIGLAMQLARYTTHMVRCLLEGFFVQNTARLLPSERKNDRSKVFGSMRGAVEHGT